MTVTSRFALGFKRFVKWTAFATVGLMIITGLAGYTIYRQIERNLPTVDALRDVQMQEPMRVYAKDGALLAIYGDFRRYPVSIEHVPETLKNSFIAAEDANFYQHQGVDFKGIARALWLLATTDNERVPGGSTITQQVARQFYLSSEYSYKRKLSEMLLAHRIESLMTKDEILELYLNKIFFGNRSYGVVAAAEFYYGKSLEELELDEMASLAAIPKFPSSANPISNPERARIRRSYVLSRMHHLGLISSDEYTVAENTPMHAKAHGPVIPVRAPYATEMARVEMLERYGPDVLESGYRVVLSLDTRAQELAEAAVVEGLIKLDRRQGWRGAAENFELAAGEEASEISARLREVQTLGGLQPAIVMHVEGDAAVAVLRNASVVELDRRASKWAGRATGALLKRGDLIRVKSVLSGETRAWELAQIPLPEAALIAIDPDSGAIEAVVGGFSSGETGLNRATQSYRQPGSSFKPFIYAAAFEKGYNPGSVFVDEPLSIAVGNGQRWSPQNLDRRFIGPTTLRQALIRSRNTISIKLVQASGVEYVRSVLGNFGFEQARIPSNLTIALGTPSLTPLSVARGYAAFVNGGFRITPWIISSVHDRHGRVAYQADPELACLHCDAAIGQAQDSASIVDGFNLGAAPVADTTNQAQLDLGGAIVAPEKLAPRAIDPRVAYQVSDMLRDVILRSGPSGRSLKRADVGGKTGSTNDQRDAWFGGFGGDLVAVVWVGRDDNRSLGARQYGAYVALPIWAEFMRGALNDKAERLNPVPAGMVSVASDANGFMRPLPAGAGSGEFVRVEDIDAQRAPVIDEPYEPEQYEKAFDIF